MVWGALRRMAESPCETASGHRVRGVIGSGMLNFLSVLIVSSCQVSLIIRMTQDKCGWTARRDAGISV